MFWHVFSPSQYVAYKIGKENVKDFEKWAFGEGFKEGTRLPEIPAMWNAQHPELLITGSDEMKTSLDKMIALWVVCYESNRITV